jgi:hypothetical protein
MVSARFFLRQESLARHYFLRGVFNWAEACSKQETYEAGKPFRLMRFIRMHLWWRLVQFFYETASRIDLFIDLLTRLAPFFPAPFPQLASPPPVRGNVVRRQGIKAEGSEWISR